MSGGSMDYLCYKVEEASFSLSTPERKAFRTHLIKVAKALKAIEWNDSGDGADDEAELIRKCLQPTDVLRAATEDALTAHSALTDELKRMKAL